MGSNVTIDVPAGTLGLTAVLRAPSGADPVGFESLAPPGGMAEEVADFRIPGTSWEFAGWGIAALGLPQSDSPAAMPPAPNS